MADEEKANNGRFDLKTYSERAAQKASAEEAKKGHSTVADLPIFMQVPIESISFFYEAGLFKSLLVFLFFAETFAVYWFLVVPLHAEKYDPFYQVSIVFLAALPVFYAVLRKLFGVEWLRDQTKSPSTFIIAFLMFLLLCIFLLFFIFGSVFYYFLSSNKDVFLLAGYAVTGFAVVAAMFFHNFKKPLALPSKNVGQKLPNKE